MGREGSKKRKRLPRAWRVIIIVIVVLAVCLIVIWPMAPLWQRLGAEVMCIEGEWPRIKIVPCAQEERAPVTAVPLPTVGEGETLPLLVDDDGSPDGVIALLFFLRSPVYRVEAVTVSYGEAHPSLFASHLAGMLAGLGRGDIPVGYGSETPLAGSNAFPDPWRQGSDEFWGIPLAEGEGETTPVPAAQLMVDVIRTSDQPVTVFVSGSHTNLAQALRLEPGIAENIAAVYIMGGSVHVPGNIHSDWPAFSNETAEWNIWVDPLAASEVFTAGLELHLVPLDATRQMTWGREDVTEWEAGGTAEGALAADLVRWMLQVWSVDSVYIWDLVTAVQASHAGACPEADYALEVVTMPGVDEGRTRMTDGEQNAAVCLEPDGGLMKGLVLSAFQQPAGVP